MQRVSGYNIGPRGGEVCCRSLKRRVSVAKRGKPRIGVAQPVCREGRCCRLPRRVHPDDDVIGIRTSDLGRSAAVTDCLPDSNDDGDWSGDDDVQNGRNR